MMDALARLFLESPFQLTILSALLLLVAYGVWLRSNTERVRRLVFPLAIGLIVALFAVQEWVTTQREDLHNTLDRLIAAVSRHDAAAVLPSISDDYASTDMDRAAVGAFIESALKNTDIFDARIGGIESDIDDDRATTEFSVTATVRVAGQTARLPSRWKLAWTRAPSGWQITQIEPLEVAGNRVSGLRALRHW